MTGVAVSVVHELTGDWRAQVYDGALLVVTGVAGLAPFRAHLEAVLADAFAPAVPPHIDAHFAPDELRARIDAVRTRFRRDQEPARALLRPVLAGCGLEPATTYWDRISLRVLPAGAQPQPGEELALAAHRDTWSSNVYQQINWWLPLYPIVAERALAFHLGHWRRPVANTSAQWDLDLVRAERASGVSDTPLIPAPSDPVDPDDLLTVVIQPGDVLLFSGAQLHATVPNTSPVSRCSVEIRTVALDDVRAGRGAPNVDGAAPRVPWHWFRRVDDGTSLGAVVATG